MSNRCRRCGTCKRCVCHEKTRRGQCDTCYRYEKRTGRKRSPDVIERYRERLLESLTLTA